MALKSGREEYVIVGKVNRTLFSFAETGYSRLRTRRGDLRLYKQILGGEQPKAPHDRAILAPRRLKPHPRRPGMVSTFLRLCENSRLEARILTCAFFNKSFNSLHFRGSCGLWGHFWSVFCRFVVLSLCRFAIWDNLFRAKTGRWFVSNRLSSWRQASHK